MREIKASRTCGGARRYDGGAAAVGETSGGHGQREPTFGPVAKTTRRGFHQLLAQL